MNVGVPGTMPCSIANTTFMSPESPAAGSECPILLLIYVFISKRTAMKHLLPPIMSEGVELTEPTTRGLSAGRHEANTEPTPAASILSPAWIEL